MARAARAARVRVDYIPPPEIAPEPGPTIDSRYERLLTEPSDIQYHLPKLKDLATGCGFVQEFGVRTGVSTVALLAGRPVTMRSYDRDPFGLADELRSEASELGIDFKFWQADDLEVTPHSPDLLFIDTLHTYAQLLAELKLHGSCVRRYIVLHDTEMFGEVGQLGGRGINDAWREWIVTSGWRRTYQTSECNGLTVLEPPPVGYRISGAL